jgi:biopolymer transport protein ExbD
MILKRKRQMKAEVPMSPLIDCVFLLLIFFLVTTMLKKTEKQIPIVLPESDLALALEADSDVLTLGVDQDGQIYLGRRGTSSDQMITYEPLDDLTLYLKELSKQPDGKQPIQLAVDRNTETQEVIKLLDIFQIQGFEHVFVRIRDGDPASG